MSSPDPNHVNIRIEISVPTGVNVSPAVQAQHATKPGDREERRLHLLFGGAGDPGTGMLFQNPFPNICVQPITGSCLGSVAIFFTYPSAPNGVRAIIYPNVVDHSDSDPPSGAQPGTSSSGNTIWTWNTLSWADHTPTLGVSLNVVHLWTQATASSPWVADANTFSFYGFSGSGSPCGSGSGPGFPLAVGGIRQPNLIVHVPDGPKAGRYRARAISATRWEVGIGEVGYGIRMAPDGKTAFFACPSSEVVSKSAGPHPIYAVFPGSLVGAAHDVVVIQE